MWLLFLIPFSDACSAGTAITRDSEIITDPTFVFQVSPPVRWTYFPPTVFPPGITIANFFPGQSINSQMALQAAQNEVQAAYLEAIADSNYPVTGGSLLAQATYSPDEISNCYTTQPIPSGTRVGYLAGGAITEISFITGTGGAGVTVPSCPLSQTTELVGVGPYQEYLKPVSVGTRGGLTLTRYSWQRIASQMQAILNFRYNVLFRSPIEIN